MFHSLFVWNAATILLTIAGFVIIFLRLGASDLSAECKRLQYELNCKKADIEMLAAEMVKYAKLQEKYQKLSATYDGLTASNVTPLQQLYLWGEYLEELRESSIFSPEMKEQYIRNMETAITDLQKTVKDPDNLVRMVKNLPKQHAAIPASFDMNKLFEPVKHELQ